MFQNIKTVAECTKTKDCPRNMVWNLGMHFPLLLGIDSPRIRYICITPLHLMFATATALTGDMYCFQLSK